MEDIQMPVLNDNISDTLSSKKSSVFSIKSNDQTIESKSTSSTTSKDERIPNLPSIYSIYYLNDVELPKIRQIGVKKSIDCLAQIFKCQNYQINLIEFWFLDIVADLLWRIQDEFDLPVDIQRVTLSWFIFFINIIRDPEHNSSKDEVFDILKEAIVIAGKCMDEGDPLIPNPSKLVEFISSSSSSTSSRSTKSDRSKLSVKSSNNEDYSVEYIEINGKNEKKIYIFSSSEESSSSSKEITSMSSFSCDDNDKNDNESFLANYTANPRVSDLPDNKNKPSMSLETDSEIIQNEEIAQKCEKAIQCLFDFVFEYFYNDFQFFIIKSVLTNPPKYKTENLDINWQYPKTIKEKLETKSTISIETTDPFEIARGKIEDNKKYLFPLNNPTTD